MRFNKKMYSIAGITLTMILWFGSVSFAGPVIGDVPASASENRTVQQATTLYTETCDISQELGFYDGSPVYLRVAQPKGPVSYVFDKTETYVRVYGGNIFNGNLRFPYVSNFVPSTTIDPDSSNVLTVDATWASFLWQATVQRNQIAWQVVTKNMERSIIQNNNGSTLNYYYRWASDNSLHNGVLKITINPNLTRKTSCTNYYVARCGDGVTDKATGTTNGNGGIMTQGNVFLPWHALSIKPNEMCDDGTLNGTPGHCKADCTGMGAWSNAPSCSLTASASTIQSGESVTLNASYTSGTDASFSPLIPGINFTYPNRSNPNIPVSPTTTTTYILTVNGAAGTTPAVCSATVNVTVPQPHLTCALSFSQNPVAANQIVNVGWNVSNGNFYWTYIYVTPQTQGARPHRVNANEYNGVTQMLPTHTGTYNFSMTVNNNIESYTCTGALRVVDNTPSTCSLTTTTPLINPRATGILQASYANASLATLTPNIAGLNFIYPNRSNTNIIVHPSVTTTYTLRTLGLLWGTWQTCSTTINVMHEWVTLTKSLVTNIPYRSGDLVTFKIEFANQWSATLSNQFWESRSNASDLIDLWTSTTNNGTISKAATTGVNVYIPWWATVNHVVLSDYLPAGLEYVDSQIFGVAPYTMSTWSNGGNQFVEYSWFSLAPGQRGYLLVVGRFKWYEYANQTLNNAFLKGDNLAMLYASALFYVYNPTANTPVIKTSDKSSYYPGENARFTIAVTNNSSDVMNNTQITDYRPNTSCVTLDSQRAANMPLVMTNLTNPYTWTYSGSLAVGQTIYLYLTGRISNTPSCVGSYVNNAWIQYTLNGQTRTGAALPLNFTVSTTPNATLSFEKKLVQYGNNKGDPVTFELLYQNNGSATITNYDIVDYRPGTLNFVSATPMPITQTPNNGWLLLRRVSTAPLAPGASGKITINGTIK